MQVVEEYEGTPAMMRIEECIGQGYKVVSMCSVIKGPYKETYAIVVYEVPNDKDHS